MKPLSILGVIPARAGSKGVKKKNIIPLRGKPLIAYTIKAAQGARLLTDFIVSTESLEIARVAKAYKAKVPFLRPTVLATDATPSYPVLQHALIEYEKLTKKHFDYMMLLQPTTPLRQPSDIDQAIRMMQRHPRADSLISCYEANAMHPRIMYKRDGKRMVPYIADGSQMTRRQGFEDVYVRNGAIYIVRRDLLFKANKIIGEHPLMMEMPRRRSINIDSYEDLDFADMFLRGSQRKVR